MKLPTETVAQTPSPTAEETIPDPVTDPVIEGGATDAGDADDAAAGLDFDGLLDAPTGDVDADDDTTTDAGDAATPPVKEEKPATELEKPASTPAEKPAPETPQAKQQREQAEQQQQQRIGEFQKTYTELRAAVDKGEYDPVEDGQKTAKILLDGLEFLSRELATVQQLAAQASQHTASERMWSKWGLKNAGLGVNAADSARIGREIYDREYEKAGVEFPNAIPEVLEAVATREWRKNVELRIRQKNARKPGAPAPGAPTPRPGTPPRKPAPTVTPGGSRTTPTGAAARPPAVVRSDEEEFAAAVKGMGIRDF